MLKTKPSLLPAEMKLPKGEQRGSRIEDAAGKASLDGIKRWPVYGDKYGAIAL